MPQQCLNEGCLPPNAEQLLFARTPFAEKIHEKCCQCIIARHMSGFGRHSFPDWEPMTKGKLFCDDLMLLLPESAMLDTRRSVGKQKIERKFIKERKGSVRIITSRIRSREHWAMMRGSRQFKINRREQFSPSI